jgi:hypothetical protein
VSLITKTKLGLSPAEVGERDRGGRERMGGRETGGGFYLIKNIDKLGPCWIEDEIEYE